jgi:hypothetical protein
MDYFQLPMMTMWFKKSKNLASFGRDIKSPGYPFKLLSGPAFLPASFLNLGA